METQRNLRSFLTSRKTSIPAPCKSASGDKQDSFFKPDLKQNAVGTKAVSTTASSSKRKANNSSQLNQAFSVKQPPATKNASNNAAKAKQSKTMTLVEFQRLRQQAGASAIKEFQASCEKLNKSPEKLQLSPFYSPVKNHVSTAEAVHNIRARRQLNFGTKSGAKTSPPKSTVKESEVDTSASNSTAFKISAEPSVSQKKENAGEKYDDALDDSNNGGSCKNDSSIIEERPSLLDSPLKRARDTYEDLNVLPSTSLCRTPQKTPRKDPMHSPTAMLSPGKVVSLFSPKKGFLRQMVRTAADVHAEFVSRDIPRTSEGETVQHQAVGLEQKQGLKRKVADVLEQTREAKRKVAELREKRLGLLHGLNTADTVPAYISKAQYTQPKPEPTEPPLPPKLKELDEIFERGDSAICTYSNRGESCCFEKLRNALLTRKKEPITHDALGYITHFFPEAYVIRVEQNSSSYACPDVRLGAFPAKRTHEHYVIYVRDDEKPIVPNEELLVSAEMDPFARVRRMRRFHSLLFTYAEKEHRQFLARLGFNLPEGIKITNWDPRWNLESVELPQPAQLPVFSRPPPPKTFEQVFKIIALPDRPMFGPKGKGKDSGAAVTAAAPKPFVFDEKKFKDPGFRYADEAAKNRIREVERKNQLSIIFKDPAVEKRRGQLDRMVQMARILSGMFNSGEVKKENDVLRTMKQSIKSALTIEQVAEHFEILKELFVPAGWIFAVKCDGETYIHRKDKSYGLVQMEEVVQAEKAKLAGN